MGTFVHCDSNGGNVTTITGVTWGTAGAAAQAGDLAVIAWVFLDTETPTDPTSESWNLALANVAGATDCEGRILYRICDGTESGDITGWSTTGTGNRQAAILFVVRGYDGISGLTVRDETANSTSHECPALTTSDGFGALFPANGDTTLVFTFDRAASTTASPPSGWATRTGSVFAATGTGGTIVGMADDGLTDASSFPVDPGPWTGQASSDDAFTVTLSLRPTSSGTTFNLEQATETDTALGLTASKSTTLGLATETGAAFAVTATKTVVLGLATETDEAFALTSSSGLIHTLGQAAETDVALALTASKVFTLGLATEVGEAFTLVAAMAAVLGLATETGSALSLAATKTTALGLAAETSTSLAITAAKAYPLGLATELDEAFALIVIDPRDITVVARLRNNHVTGGVVLTDLIAGLRSSHITGGVDVPRSMLTGSVEYVTAEVTFVGETAAGIATVTGQVKITSDDTIPSSFDNADVTERTDVNGGALLALKKLHTAGVAGEYRVWAKVSDNPEVPILKCGTFTVR